MVKTKPDEDGELYKTYYKTDLETRSKIKNLIFYATKCNYELSFSNYETIEDVIKDANHIRFYGNESSVRRAIRLINLDNKIIQKKISFKLLMSDKVKDRLQRENSIQQQTKTGLKIIRKPHIIKFE
jgi:hypothetical protein